MVPSIISSRPSLSLRYYWHQVRKRWWLVLLLGLLGMMVGGYQLLSTRPLYQSSTQLLIEERVGSGMVPFRDPLAHSGRAPYLQTQLRVLRSRSLALQVVETLQLEQHPEFSPADQPEGLGAQIGEWVKAQLGAGMRLVGWQPSPSAVDAQMGGAPLTGFQAAQDWVQTRLYALSQSGLSDDRVKRNPPVVLSQTEIARQVLRRLQVVPAPNANIVSVKFQAYDPQLAAEVPNTWARLYTELGREMRFSAAQDSIEWLNERVEEMRQKVEASELALEEYKEQNDLYSVGDRLPGVSGDLAAVSAKLTQVRTERIELETLMQQIEKASGQTGAVQWMASVMPSEVLQELRQGQDDLRRAFGPLSRKYGPDHPRVAKARAALNAQQRKIQAEVQKGVQATQTQLEVVKAQEAALLQQVTKLKAEAHELNRKAIRFGVLKRDAESNRQLSDVLLTRLKQTSISPELTGGSNIRVMDQAEVPKAPVNFRPAWSLSIAGVIGLLLGAGLSVGLGYLDNTLKTPDEAQEYLGFPVIGFIGRHGSRREARSGNPSGLIALESPHSPTVEAFKMLRANILFSYADTPRKVFLVTSPHPNEGKTTVAANLAVVTAQMDRRVLLIGGDLRNATLDKLFDTQGQAGLSELLLTEKYDELRVLPDEDFSDGNFTVIPAGERPGNPSELLGSKRMERFIEFAREHYDTIIIDSPPLLAVSDAMVLSPLVDGILVVLRANRTSLDHASRAISRMVALNAEASVAASADEPESERRTQPINLGLVMNFLNPREGHSYGYYGYRGYNNYYSYGDDEK